MNLNQIPGVWVLGKVSTKVQVFQPLNNTVEPTYVQQIPQEHPV